MPVGGLGWLFDGAFFPGGMTMTHEAPLELPVAVQVDKALLEAAQQVPAPPLPIPPSDAEHMRALDAAFDAQEKESQQVAGLLGLWAGTALLHDLAIETFTEPAGEVKLEKKKQPKDDEHPEYLPPGTP